MNYSIASKDFNSIFKKSSVYISNDFVCYFVFDGMKRIGFIVSKKYGNAVKRNRFKRACRLIFIKHPIALNVSIILKPKNYSYNYSSLKLSFKLLFGHLSVK